MACTFDVLLRIGATNENILFSGIVLFEMHVKLWREKEDLDNRRVQSWKSKRLISIYKVYIFKESSLVVFKNTSNQ
jgi:hypothetical protein